MFTTPLALDAVTETYHDVEGLLDQIAWRFIRRYGGEYNEIRSEANIHFLAAYSRFDSSEGEFKSWVNRRVFLCLLETLRKKIMRNNRLPRTDADPDSLVVNTSSFIALDFLDELSEDARTIVSLVLEGSMDVNLATYERGGDNPKPHHIRWAIWEVCKDFGWTFNRMKESFQEIREALR
jgi:hypothetical protein